MTVVTVASYLQAASHPAHNVRRLTRSMFANRGGVVPSTATFTDLQVTQRGAGANMSVDVAEGSCLVAGTESVYQGLYHGENQGVQNVVITAANVTNPRRDMIVARIKDTEYGVAVTDAFSLEAIAGTPAGSPADPTIPDNCIVLARVAVAANATSITNANITDLRNGYTAVTGASTIGNQVQAVALGGIVPVLSTFLPTKGLYEGQALFETDTDIFRYYTGSAWQKWNAPAGQLAYKTLVVEQTGIQTTLTDITGLSATVTMPAGRRVELLATVSFRKAGADTTGYAAAAITDGSNTVIWDANQNIAVSTYASAVVRVRVNASTGSNTWKVRANTNAGFVNIPAATFSVEDIGLATLPT